MYYVLPFWLVCILFSFLELIQKSLKDNKLAKWSGTQIKVNEGGTEWIRKQSAAKESQFKLRLLFFFIIRVKVHYLIRLFYTFPSAFSLVNSSSPLGMDSGMVYSVKRDRRSKVVLSYRFFLQFKTKV